MPSVIAHPFVALALAPCFRRRGMSVGLAALGAVCTIAPDLDVIGFHLGVPYAGLFGHRGFTHSLFFAALLAASLAFVFRASFRQASFPMVSAFLFLCTASHGVLDALTDGGLGVAFFSPFSNARCFFPWHPIAVSPLSVSRFLAGRATPVLASEFVWVMLPSLLFATLAWSMTRPAGSQGKR